MVTHNIINAMDPNMPASLSEPVISYLRDTMGFDGVVMTDWYATSRGRASSAAALAAGNDLIMPGGPGFKGEILRGVRSGVITEADARQCCGNVIRAILNSAIQREYQ